MAIFLLSGLLIIYVGQGTCRLSNDKDELLNWCLSSTNHKFKPGKEDSLHGQCTPWKDHACCTSKTTHDLHSTNMYNFTLDHCFNQTGNHMSQPCQRFFLRNNCFYECEPHIGFWVVKTKRKIADERFFKVPLCASECDHWWEACKNDFTCAYNWPRNFKFKNGHNYCPENSKCQKFELIYQNASNFCENVWDHSFVYTSDNQACMKIWFDESKGNPNKNVADYYINEHFGGAKEFSASVLLCLIMFMFYLIML